MPADAVGLEVEALVEAVFDANAGFADAYTAELPALMPKAGEHVGHEENVEAGLLQRNDGTADVCCFDRQVQLPGTRRTVDIVGSTSKNAPTLVAIEVKRYPDNRITACGPGRCSRRMGSGFWRAMAHRASWHR